MRDLRLFLVATVLFVTTAVAVAWGMRENPTGTGSARTTPAPITVTTPVGGPSTGPSTQVTQPSPSPSGTTSSGTTSPGASSPGATGGGATTSGTAWAPPPLEAAVTIQVSQSHHSLKLKAGTDYRLVLPDRVLDLGSGSLSINGGHDVVLIGGALTGTGKNGIIRATGQTGTLHIEGVAVTGDGLREGIQLQNEGSAIVQLQNIRFDTVRGSQSGHHADLVQTWGGGPKALRIDRLTGSTTYQAFMLADGGGASGWDFRHVNVTHQGSGGWTMYDGGPSARQIAMTQVWFAGNAGNGVWSLGHGGILAGLSWGVPPGGDFVPAGLAGTGYGTAHR